MNLRIWPDFHRPSYTLVLGLSRIPGLVLPDFHRLPDCALRLAGLSRIPGLVLPDFHRLSDCALRLADLSRIPGLVLPDFHRLSCALAPGLSRIPGLVPDFHRLSDCASRLAGLSYIPGLGTAFHCLAKQTLCNGDTCQLQGRPRLALRRPASP
jgi:hypothetical protein